MAGLKVITKPAVEPVLLDDVKPQLRIETSDTDYDGILTPLIVAAREWCEGYQNRAYITQTLELALDYWPYSSRVELPRPQTQSIMSVKHTDNDGVESTWDISNYSLDTYAYVAALVKGRNIQWPSEALAVVNAIKIRYIAGYGNAGTDVPQAIKQAIVLLTTHWFENGMCEPPMAVYSLLNLDRLMPI